MELGIAQPLQTPLECCNNEQEWELNYAREIENIERSRRVRAQALGPEDQTRTPQPEISSGAAGREPKLSALNPSAG